MKKLCLLVFFFYSLQAIAQYGRDKFGKLTIGKSLSQNYVLSIFQDHYGYMWFGTWDGVARYDGFDFDIFKPDLYNPKSLNNNCVTAIYEDEKHQLWVGTNGGGISVIPSYYFFVNKKNGLSGIHNTTIEPLRFKAMPGSNKSINNNNITAFCRDGFGRIWIGTYGGGLNVCVPDSQNTYRFAAFMADPNKEYSIVNNNITRLYTDKTGTIWVATEGGISIFMPTRDISKIEFSTIQSASGSSLLSDNSITAIGEDAQGNMWIGTKRGLFLLVPAASSNSVYTYYHFTASPGNSHAISNNIIESIHIDKNNTVWIGTANGLNKLLSFNLQDLSSVKFFCYTTDPSDEYSISDNTIESMYEDRSGVLWIGTYRGLNRLNIVCKKFDILQGYAADKNSLPDNIINAIYADKNHTLWIGSENGVFSGISTEGSMRHFLIKDGSIKPLMPSIADIIRKKADMLPQMTLTPGVNFFSGNFINAITADNDGLLWIGGVGLYRFNPFDNDFTYYYPFPGLQTTISGWAVWDLCKDDNDNIWIATSNGLNIYLPQKDIFLHLMHNEDDNTSLSSNKVFCLLKDKKGMMWVGTDSGLNKVLYDKNTLTQVKDIRFKRYNHNPENINSLSSDKIWSLYAGDDNTIWIGTEGGGLQKMTEQISGDTIITTIVRYTETDGLAGNIVCAIAEDKAGYLWISTTNGLSRLHIASNVFRTYSYHDGLASDEFMKNAVFCNDEGKLFFGSRNGLVMFFPDSIKDNPVAPLVVITDIKLFNRSVPPGPMDDGRTILTRPVCETSHILLSHTDDAVTFEFVALHFQHPVLNRYRYKMVGFEKEWNYTTHDRRFAHYTNLPSGRYSFIVSAANPDGIWNEQGAAIDITVLPPFWFTGWAYSLYAIIFLLLIYAIYLYIVSQERLRTNLHLMRVEAEKKAEYAQKTEEVNQMKIRFFTNISHEFRTPLTLILGPIENLLSLTSNMPSIRQQILILQRNAQHMLRLINQLMDFRKLEIGGLQVKAEKKDLIRFVEYVMTPFRFLARQRHIHFTLDTGVKNLEMYFDHDMMEKVLNNLISNAFKFTPERGEISVKITCNSTFHYASYQKEYGERYPEGFVDIFVKDSGIGIVPEKHKLIFDRYYQVESKESKGGTGIGLALARELVELHNGEISVQSMPNQGATFRVRLPLGEKHFAKEQIIEKMDGDTLVEEKEYMQDITFSNALQVKEEPSVLNEAVPQILVVEDNPDLRLYINLALKNEYIVEEADSGRAGLHKAIESIPDLIITDIMMPDMDGFELCEKIRKNEKTCHVPLIMLTALSGEEARIKGLETGADDYITKPFSTPLLQTRVRNLLEIRKTLKEKFSRGILSDPVEYAVVPQDKAFVQKIIQLIEKHMIDNELSVESFSEELGLSRAQLYRKIKGSTGLTVTELLRSVRMKKAAALLLEGKMNVNEIMYAVGYVSQSYFNKCFKEIFNVTPSEYAMCKSQEQESNKEQSKK